MANCRENSVEFRFVLAETLLTKFSIQGPGGGAILQNYGPTNNWTGLWVYGGVSCAVAAAIFTVVRFMKAGGKLMVKV